MYIRTPESPRLGLGQPPATQPVPLRVPKFTSNAIMYKDKDAADKLRPTLCSVYVPSALRNRKVIDLMVFFHGYDTCPKQKHNFDPELVIKNFRLDDQVENAQRKVALAVPSVFWKYKGNPNGSDLKNIQAAWSAAYLNDFVDEVLEQIGRSSSIDRTLSHLILAGHSGAYNILTPLAEQFHLGVRATWTRALAQLYTVLAMDTTYGRQDAKALEQWARDLNGKANFTLVLNNGSEPKPPDVWKTWRKRAGAEPLTNLTVEQKTGRTDGHCALVSYVGSYLL